MADAKPGNLEGIYLSWCLQSDETELRLSNRLLGIESCQIIYRRSIVFIFVKLGMRNKLEWSL